MNTDATKYFMHIATCGHRSDHQDMVYIVHCIAWFCRDHTVVVFLKTRSFLGLWEIR